MVFDQGHILAYAAPCTGTQQLRVRGIARPGSSDELVYLGLLAPENCLHELAAILQPVRIAK